MKTFGFEQLILFCYDNCKTKTTFKNYSFNFVSLIFFLMILFIKILKLLSWVPVQNISYRIEIQTINKPKATNTDNVIPSISWRPWPPEKRLVMKSLIVIRVMDEALYSSVRSPPYGSRQRPRRGEFGDGVFWDPASALREINLHYECSVRLKRMICHCEPLLWRSWCTGLDKEKDIHQWLEIFLDDKSTAQGRPRETLWDHKNTSVESWVYT